MLTKEKAIAKKTTKKTVNKKCRKQIIKNYYPSMDEQVREFAEIIVSHLLNNPKLWT